MKKFIVTAFVFTLLATTGARADAPSAQTALCKSGSVLAACPPGVQSNVSVAAPSFQNANQSVALGQNSNQSVGIPLNNNASVYSPLSNSGSVAWGANTTSTGNSVAYTGNTNATSMSVASGVGGGSAQSVVH